MVVVPVTWTKLPVADAKLVVAALATLAPFLNRFFIAAIAVAGAVVLSPNTLYTAALVSLNQLASVSVTPFVKDVEDITYHLPDS